MKGLILAAGQGERLGILTKNTPKPLLSLLGLSLLERVILTAKETGIREFVIVVGYLGEKIKAKLGKGENLGVKITWVENKRWSKGNGLSVLAAKKFLSEKFVLLMSDHLFQPQILSAVLASRNKETVVLVVEKRKPLAGETKVLTKRGKVVAIGKEIKRSNGVDTGIFLCRPKIFSYLEKAVKKGKTELAEGVAQAAKEKEVGIFDLNRLENYSPESKSWWLDIDTKKDLEKAKKLLIKGLSKPTDGPISRWLNRPISTKVTQLLLKTNLSPNLITFLSFIGGIIAGLLFSWKKMILGGLMAQIASIIDGCDGEVARLKFAQSNYGAWFDAVLDRYADAAIILGMTFNCWQTSQEGQIWLIGFFALIGSFMNSYTADKYDASFGKKMPRTRWSIRIGRDARLFLIMIGALFGQIFFTLVILGILTNLEVIRRIFVLKEKLA